MFFCAYTMEKINLDLLNEMMAKQIVRLKKSTVGSFSTLKAVVPEIASVVDALPLQIIAPDEVGPARETEQEPKMATPRVIVPRLDDEDKFQAIMASPSQRRQSVQTAPEPTGVESPIKEVLPPLKCLSKRTRCEEVKTKAVSTPTVETGEASTQWATTESTRATSR